MFKEKIHGNVKNLLNRKNYRLFVHFFDLDRQNIISKITPNDENISLKNIFDRIQMKQQKKSNVNAQPCFISANAYRTRIPHVMWYLS